MRLHTGDSTVLAGRTLWPDSVAFREAIQHPSGVLSDPDLQEAEVVLDRRGLPLTYSGRFAVVFRLRTADGDWALRCFTQAAEGQERSTRYTAVAPHLQRQPQYFVPFRYHSRGIRIGTSWYPVVAMRWAEGETLGRFIERHVHDPAVLQTLCGSLHDLLDTLESAGIAHGDWQHDNILVSEGGSKLTLVDYDGMFVPELSGYEAAEIGHVNYQHPSRSRAHFGVGLDRFSHMVMQTALRALCHDPSLWSRFSDGESLLFKRDDFDNPEGSALFRALRAGGRSYPDLQDCVAELESACRAGVRGLLASAPSLLGPPVIAGAKTLPAVDPKWWLDPEHQQEARPVSGVSPVATARKSYLDYLSSRGFRKEEEQYVLTARFVSSGAAFWLLSQFFSMMATGESALGILLGPVMAVLLLICAYMPWPVRMVQRELTTELDKLDRMIINRVDRIAGEKNTLPVVAETREEFVRLSLQSVRLFKLQTVDAAAVLRAAHIRNGSDLLDRLPVAGLSDEENDALEDWCAELVREAEASYEAFRAEDEEEFQRLLAERQLKQVNLKRLTLEVAGFRERREELERERDDFPPAAFSAFLKRLAGRA